MYNLSTMPLLASYLISSRNMVKKESIENQKTIATAIEAEAGIEVEVEDGSQQPNAYNSLIFLWQ